ncbi:MAG: LysR family transcriptional regulator [Rhodospirillales bacterium]|nr:LysR family transcriptional regulator [Rhodospirillales bacterium]
MNIKGLRAFILIMTEGTLADAARVMNLSESSISRHVSLLEDELGVPLFTREKRQLTPTTYGEAFLVEAHRIVDAIDDVPRIIDSIKAGPNQQLRLVTMPRLANCIAGPAIIRLVEEMPDVNVSVDVRPFRLFEAWVAALQFDLGLGSLPAVHDAVRSDTLCNLPAVAVLPPGHPLAERRYVEAQDLAPYPLVATLSGTRIRRQMDSVFAKSDTVPRIRVEAAATSLACGIVAEGYGYTIADPIIPMSVGAGRLVVVPIKPRVDMEFGFIYPRSAEPTPLALRFVEIARDVTRDFLREHMPK